MKYIKLLEQCLPNGECDAHASYYYYYEILPGIRKSLKLLAPSYEPKEVLDFQRQGRVKVFCSCKKYVWKETLLIR